MKIRSHRLIALMENEAVIWRKRACELDKECDDEIGDDEIGDDEKGDDEKGDDEKGEDEKGEDEKGEDEKGEDQVREELKERIRGEKNLEGIIPRREGVVTVGV